MTSFEFKVLPMVCMDRVPMADALLVIPLISTQHIVVSSI